ncbi:hypothetical protein LTR99_005114 [Exophiala xenobiotica]|uniref:SAP domain-containing protein n=1 Tax=Vermiconidia calcicola TaxID=1690605 RepID=A0AAV9QGR9_9PEZI|nr:hypothetical protein H2202_005485 [Exophiala xenobiotica]KAK5536420.1 hypothetical protein LTR23_007854 [Chaetothyriales sp. CCFEE 6169]KAK5541405.1 hypothetical protein LTR25_003182 [Vermiconidia calcicola]KAK5196323.1 hypothetical protein LTR92_003868 [Exophiala xenobiotica]KAK5214257.1 hypothetical protein LTR41_000449 [Exophiala xenobiotica]
MVDYASKTVAQLQDVLRSRSLPHSGKKAELIARLEESDVVASQKEEPQAAAEDAPAPPAESTTAPPAQVSEPAAQPTAETPAPTETAPATTEAETIVPDAANNDAAEAVAASFALSLPSSEVDSEMARRKARAERFGTGAADANGETGAAGTDEAETEASKALERAKRFGTGQTALGKLDEPLSSETKRDSRRRGGRMEGEGRGGGRFRGRGRDNSQRRRPGEKPTGISKQSTPFSSEADRMAAEARKKKFASTA